MLTVFGLLALAYLMLPIAVVIVFSFNDPAGRFNYTWAGLHLDNWLHPFDSAGLGDAVSEHRDRLLSTLVATVLGTLIALALVRYRFRGRGATNLLIFLPMATPEIVLGASLLTLFLNLLGTAARLLDDPDRAHHVQHQLRRRDREGAPGRLRPPPRGGGDGLWAPTSTTFFSVTLPLIAPAILAGALLAFSLSIDDFVITYFNSGATTFPLFVWGAARTASRRRST